VKGGYGKKLGVKEREVVEIKEMEFEIKWSARRNWAKKIRGMKRYRESRKEAWHKKK